MTPFNTLPKPRVEKARCKNGILHLTLGGAALEGATLSVPARNIRPIANLSDEELAKVEIFGNGHVLVWRDADAEFAVMGLIERIVGVRSQHAHMEAIARATSEAKTVAARANGQKGGRPRRKVAA